MWLWVVLAACVVTRVGFAFAVPLCAEDAYITFRYAFHAGHGMGFAYNPGEASWGYTSLLWTTLLAGAARVGLPLETFARVFLTLCDLGTIALVYRKLAPTTRVGAISGVAFFALWPRFAHLPATGLETSLVTFLVAAAVTQSKNRWGAMFAGLLALSRPEGLAMSVLLLPLYRTRGRLLWLAITSLYAIPMLHYHQLAPSSVASKATVYGTPWFTGGYWLEWLVPFMKPRTEDGMAMGGLSVVWLVGLAAFVVRARRSRPFAPALPLVLACGLGTLVGYAVLGVPWYFWYAPTPMFAIIVVACMGLASQRVLHWGYAVLALGAALAWNTSAPRTVRAQTHDAAVYENIGLTLHDDAAGREASVLLEPIGIVGWTSELRVLDEVGLVTPWIAAERRRGDGWYGRVIAREQPEYVVIRRDWLAGGVGWAGIGAPFVSAAERDSVMAAYEPVRRRAGAALPPGAARLQILRRVSP